MLVFQPYRTIFLGSIFHNLILPNIVNLDKGLTRIKTTRYLNESVSQGDYIKIIDFICLLLLCFFLAQDLLVMEVLQDDVWLADIVE